MQPSKILRVYNQFLMPLHLDTETLQAALAGYELQLMAINSRMAEIRRQLKQSSPADRIAAKSIRKRRRVSAAARARMAAAQRARWARVKRAQKKADH
jgi:hypothetical protein